MCCCLTYTFTAFSLSQMADIGFQNCFPNTLFLHSNATCLIPLPNVSHTDIEACPLHVLPDAEGAPLAFGLFGWFSYV